MHTIQLNNVVPSFISDTTAASEVWRNKFDFCKGEFTLVSAVSGAGKSSLLSYIFGERSDYKGEILYDGQNINLLKASQWNNVRKTKLSFVFQGLRLFSELTAFENIAIKNRLTQQKTDKEIVSMLECAGLGAKKDEKAARLSFGQQQRVATIRALCQPFDLLLLDEPFSHLDDSNVAAMTAMILQELQQNNAGMLLCSLGPEYLFPYHRKLKL